MKAYTKGDKIAEYQHNKFIIIITALWDGQKMIHILSKNGHSEYWRGHHVGSTLECLGLGIAVLNGDFELIKESLSPNAEEAEELFANQNYDING